MCVIAYKPKGVEMPSSEILAAMSQANSDGCGFCTPTKYYRGLSFNSFMKHVKHVGEDEPCIIHFRLATHGSVKKGNCHPFYDAEADTYFAHNGVLHIQTHKDMTDSETAFRNIFLPNIKLYGLWSDNVSFVAKQVIADNGSRFAFMQGDDVRLFGKFQYYEGCLYSNLRFLYYTYCIM